MTTETKSEAGGCDVTPLNKEEALRYSRQILLPGFDLDKQERLKASSALMIGVGGLGCSCAQFLVAAGLGTMTIVDDDAVELSNLQRQVLHRESSIGANKAESASQRLKEIAPDCAITACLHRLTDTELLEAAKRHDIIIDCTDNLATRLQLNRVSLQAKKTLVSGAAIRMEGQVSCFIPGQDNPCYGCISHFIGDTELTCVEAGVMSPVVGIVGAFQALEAIKALTNFGDVLVGKLAVFDFMRNEWRTLKAPKRKDCEHCQ